MSIQRVIVAGAGVVDTKEDGRRHFEIMRAESCNDVQRLLDRDRTVGLVCTDVRLPDGSWCDILRLVVNLRMSAEVRVIGRNGAPALRLQVRPRRCSVLASNTVLREDSALSETIEWPSIGQVRDSMERLRYSLFQLNHWRYDPMEKGLFRAQGQSDVILTKPVTGSVVFSPSRGSGVKPPASRNKTPGADIFFSVWGADAMTTEQKALPQDEMISPHFRQRVAFIAALIRDLDNANWPAISDTWDNLWEETKGTPLEKSIGLLREPIRRQDTHALAQTIDALLRDN
jgi:hypothetical protein